MTEAVGTLEIILVADKGLFFRVETVEAASVGTQPQSFIPVFTNGSYMVGTNAVPVALIKFKMGEAIVFPVHTVQPATLSTNP